jgi:hypothetical protein
MVRSEALTSGSPRAAADSGALGVVVEEIEKPAARNASRSTLILVAGRTSADAHAGSPGVFV